jgi:4-diphosphocytidyl-2-C-methyl-D-erythritol kinase
VGDRDRALRERAPAKVNLTLRILGRRADGYHELESLVVFASVGDVLELFPGDTLALDTRGPTAAASGALADNLVLKAAHALAARIAGLRTGRFVLEKRLPVAAGLGGGSSDAAATLRLLARLNGLAPDDARLLDVARATGADVPVCLDPRPRLMRGIGEVLTGPLTLPRLPAVLVNPGVPVPTRDVFGKIGLAKGEQRALRAADPDDVSSADALLAYVADGSNDLEPPAIALQPVIADVLAAMSRQAGCRLARMSGSGATCFAVFGSAAEAEAAAGALGRAQPGWWVAATELGAGWTSRPDG